MNDSKSLDFTDSARISFGKITSKFLNFSSNQSHIHNSAVNQSHSGVSGINQSQLGINPINQSYKVNASNITNSMIDQPSNANITNIHNLSSVNHVYCKTNVSCQSEFKDDGIFPPFDHRICLRCKQNDLISPEFCKYQNIQNIENLSFHSAKSNYKISKSHIYGVNQRWKTKQRSSNYENFLKKNDVTTFNDRTVNTIISNSVFIGKDFIELKSPRDC